ncbi:MAG: hypothetical protein U9R08_05100 [Nanoarchaeota archaeon]|nr:hypothetical protein [Nanoarchaeota archaeon]
MKSVEELEKTYAEELKRRDELINELRKQNRVLMKTVIKQSEEKVDMNKRMQNVVKEL